MSEVTAKHEILLYRCDCTHCDVAEKELQRLTKLHRTSFIVHRVKKGGDYADRETPIVYVNGVRISHYALSYQKWERALAAPLERRKIRGEVVDLHCYDEKGAHGPEHQNCAELCVNELKLPLGLLTVEGDLYRLVSGSDSGAIYEELKQKIGRQAELTGDVYQWEGKRTLTVSEPG